MFELSVGMKSFKIQPRRTKRIRFYMYQKKWLELLIYPDDASAIIDSPQVG
jgi:hypothetical protein